MPFCHLNAEALLALGLCLLSGGRQRGRSRLSLLAGLAARLS